VLKAELLGFGVDVNVVTINIHNGVKDQDKLVEECTYPLLQDTKEIDAWNVLNGTKDDFYFYDSQGTLAAYLAIDGDVSINMQTTAGYSNVRDLLMVIE